MVFSRAWDTDYEASPLGSQAADQLDTRIQEVKADVRQRVAAEHYMVPGTATDETPDGVHMFHQKTLAQRNAISAPKEGQLVVRSETRSIDIYMSSAWVEFMAWQTGDMKMAAYDNAADIGWQKCDGSAISRTTYADLFAVISDDFGVGDGSTTFNVPDLSGKFPIGIDSGGDTDFDVMADEGGEKDHTLLEAELPDHTHDGGDLTTDDPGDHKHDLQINDTGTDDGVVDNASPTEPATDDTAMAAAGAHTHTIASGTTGTGSGSGTAMNNMPPFITMQWYIKL